MRLSKSFVLPCLMVLTIISLLSASITAAQTPTPNYSTHQTSPHATQYSQTQELAASDGQDRDFFGAAVAYSSDGNTLIVGAYGSNNPTNNGAVNSGTVYIYTKGGSGWTYQARLAPPDPVLYGDFGKAVALSADGNTAIVGADAEGGDFPPGAAYIYVRSGGNWSLQQEIFADDNYSYDDFGGSVSLSADGNTALIGAWNKNVNDVISAGTAYVFKRSGSSWTQSTEIALSDPAQQDNFGWSVQLTADAQTAFIGAFNRSVSSMEKAGSVYVYTQSNGNWTQQQTLTAPDAAADDNFGQALSISGDSSTLLVGAASKNVSNQDGAGAAYIYAKSGGSWIFQKELTADTPFTQSLFGTAVSLSNDGNIALIGAPGAFADQNGISYLSAGEAYTYSRSGASWTQQQILTASDVITNASFGTGVALTSDGSSAAVGAPEALVNGNVQGATYIFGQTSAPPPTTTTPVPTTTSTPPPTSTTPPSGGNYTYNLPLLANNANSVIGQTTTYVTLQNLSTSAAANVSVHYYNSTTGSALDSSDSVTILANGQKAISPNLAAGSTAGGIVTSNQPLNLVVSESLNGGGSAYSVPASTAATLYSPLALNGQYGFTTSFIIFNAGNASSNITVKYYNENGEAVVTNSYTIPAHASQTIKQGGSTLSNTHTYWAKISGGSNDSLTAQVVEFGPNNFVATFNAATPSQLSTTLYAPATFNGQFNFTTGMGFANPNSNTASVKITYYDAAGNSLLTQPVTIPANGDFGVYQPGVNGLPQTVTSASVTSNQPLIMTVNERGPGTIAGTYLGSASGNSGVALPVMANGFVSFITGATVFNTGSSVAHITFTYYNGDGSATGTRQTVTIAPNASYLVYQGDSAQGLTSGFFGTALITSDQPLLVTTNALQTGTGLFYTYTEPTK